jgi:hypothetical protein
MFRSLIIVAALALIYLLIKNHLQSRKSRRQNSTPHSSKDTAQCAECETYIPHNEAIFSDKQTFCCKQHQRDWQKKQG